MTDVDEPTTAEHDHLDLYREMLRIRRFEERCVELYSAERDPRASCTSTSARKRSPSGVMRALRTEDDVVADLSRARSRPRARCDPGLDHGRDVRSGRGLQPWPRRVDAPVRRRHALLRRQRDRRWWSADRGRSRARRPPASSGRGVTRVFFGEGAVAEGEFHECMNLAALWRLPGALLLREQPLRDGHRRCDRSESETDIALQAVHLRDGGLVRRRHGRRRGRARPRSARSSRSVAAADRTSSSAAPTGSVPTRCTTPSSTATQRRWSVEAPGPAAAILARPATRTR